MRRDFRTWIILLAFSLPVMAALFIGSIYVYNCGFNNNCTSGFLAQVVHTPIPTLPPATLPPVEGFSQATPTPAPCSAPASTILEGWVSAGSSQDQPFNYVDPQGNNCAATFADVQSLFDQANLWYPGALACTACHNADLEAAAAGLDLSSYSGVLAGSGRSGPNATGTDILGGGVWSQSLLNQALFVQKQMPFDAPTGSLSDNGPLIQAGQQVAAISITPTVTEEVEVARPSSPGGPGEAINLNGDPTAGAAIYQSSCETCHGPQGTDNVPNPGSTDGTVPPLNPIDPTIASADYKTFATNVDLFVQHGSEPEGPNPAFSMPAWGDTNALSQQQIADVIAYVISLNQQPAVGATATSTPTPTQAATATPTASSQVPRPSNPGGPGAAVSLTSDPTTGATLFQDNCATCHGNQGMGGVANPGSTLGMVPALNPINPLLKDPDPMVFATNIDLFIQHGSIPAGPNPFRSMPAWGDQDALTQQQIADLIAYIISLNP